MIEIQNLSKKYGNIKALDDVSFRIEKGEIVGFLGPNGAGKSTTMNIITGYIPATFGSVKVCSYDISESPNEVKKRIGYLPEIPPLYLDMTVEEYLNFVAELKLIDKNFRKERVKEVIELIKITDVRKRLIKNLSKGYKQRVGLAQAIISSPEVLILDEPTVGLDPKQIIEMREFIKSLGKNHTIILSSHILSEISAICDRAVIINKGKIVANIDLTTLERPLEEIFLELTDEITENEYVSEESKLDEIKSEDIENIEDIEDISVKEEDKNADNI